MPRRRTRAAPRRSRARNVVASEHPPPASQPARRCYHFAAMGWRSTSPFSGELLHDVIVESHESVQLGFEDAFLVAVRAEALRPVFLVDGRTHAVALDAARAQKR